MKTVVAFIILTASISLGSICVENINVNVYHGWNDVHVLDSANWDIVSGGDRNYYQYNSTGRIKTNIRKTSNIIDTTQFTSITKDSIIWETENVTGINWIKYISLNSFNSRIDDGYGTIYSDTIIFDGDSIIGRGSTKYESDKPELWKSLAQFKNNEYNMKTIIDSDTTLLNCIESLNSCACTRNGIAGREFKRTINGAIINDTLWVNGVASQSRHYSEKANSAIRIKTESINQNRIIDTFDLKGRSQ